jgi:hypothetical protein
MDYSWFYKLQKIAMTRLAKAGETAPRCITQKMHGDYVTETYLVNTCDVVLDVVLIEYTKWRGGTIKYYKQYLIESID